MVLWEVLISNLIGRILRNVGTVFVYQITRRNIQEYRNLNIHGHEKQIALQDAVGLG